MRQKIYNNKHEVLNICLQVLNNNTLKFNVYHFYFKSIELSILQFLDGLFYEKHNTALH